MRKKICILTSSRSEYGILKNLISLFKKSKFFKLEIIVTGAHLSKYFGKTINEMIDDGISIDHKVYIKINKDDHQSVINQSSILVKAISKKLNSIKPDLLLLLGDRFEVFLTTYAAFLMNIPVAHIHGGEITRGSIDNAFRFSISKMSNLHLVATKKSKKKLIQYDIEKKNIFHVGSPSVSNLNDINFYSKIELEKILKFKFKKKNILVTLHPTTKENIDYREQINSLLKSLSKLNHIGMIFSKPSNDIGHKYFIEKIKIFTKKNPNSVFISSLGRNIYFSCLKTVDIVIGNSSSGIIEAPSLGCRTLNIGKRQFGREQSESIVNTTYNSKEISQKLKKIINKKHYKNYFNPYYKKNTNLKIVNLLKNYFKVR